MIKFTYNVELAIKFLIEELECQERVYNEIYLYDIDDKSDNNIVDVYLLYYNELHHFIKNDDGKYELVYMGLKK